MPVTPMSRRSWRQTLAVYRRPEVLTMLFLGFSAGLPFLLVFSTLGARLRMSGVDVATIGYFSWIGILYSIKFFWAPVVDRLPLPLLCRLLGHRRGWMLAAQTLILLGLVGMALVEPSRHLLLIAWLALIVAFGAATQDIVVDAFRIESAEESLQAAMSSVYIIGYRGGLLAAGAGALALAGNYSWSIAYLGMAGLAVIGMLTVLLRPEPPRPPLASQLAREPKVRTFLRRTRGWPRVLKRAGAWCVGAIICPFTDFFTRFGWYALALLVFIGLFRISDLSMAAMANPLYVDLGFSAQRIGEVTGLFGLAMTLLGGLLGGLLAARYGVRPLLWIAAALVAATNLLFAQLALSGANLWMLVVTITGDNLTNGMASAIFIAFLSGLTSRAYTATQYALFSSIMTLPGKFIGGFSGTLVEAIGYPSFFVYVSLLGLPAVALAAWIARDRRFSEPTLTS
ncbi:AmpG family muropeptide MFS transporter [Halotalea alkalilenta]|uniref:AmpG family muropeptide MFS transporter n=1 Tax=Halotalea alkalilenta TaxID=376489 RepID=UPI0004827D8D|nr:MFS transporter [Halotalea alkalilenta]